MSDVNTTTPAPAPTKVKAKAKKATKAKAKAKAKAAPKAEAPKAKAEGPRPGTKVASLIEAMKSAKGISTEEAAKRFDWETKSIRGVISGTIRAKLGLKVVTEVDEKRGNVYRIK